MRKFFKYILVSFLSFAPFLSSSQYIKEFGDVKMEDFEEAKFESYEDAEAIVISDKGITNFFEEDGYKIRFIRTKRIKILQKSGFKWANISIPFYTDGYGKTEEVIDIEAASYNLVDGRIIKSVLDPSTVLKEKYNDKWDQVKFAIPQVKEGTIIEFKYTHETPFLFNLPDWEFQNRIPTLASEYEVAIIPFYEYIFIAQGMNRFHKQNNFERTFETRGSGYNEVELKENVFQFGMINIPPFESEKFITSLDDYIMKIDFQLSKVNYLRGGSREIMTTYPKMTTAFLKSDSYGRFLNQSEKQTKDITTTLQISGLDERGKIKAITDYVKENFSWDGYSRRYAYENAKTVLEKKTGNCTELNLLLVGMLRSAGLNAYPVLLSTRDHGKLNSSYPFEEDFNYTIAYVELGSGGVLLDATEPNLHFNHLPPRCLNEKGLIVKGKTESWVVLTPRLKSGKAIRCTTSIDPDAEQLNGTFSISSYGYEAYEQRTSFKDNTVLIEKNFLEKINDIKSIKTRFYDNLSRPYIISMEGSIEIEQVGKQYLIPPFSNFPISKNPLIGESRSYPVDMVYSSKSEYSNVIQIPEGYAAVGIPEELSIANELADIQLTAIRQDNQVKVDGTIHFKKDIYQPAEYKRVKHYFDQIVKYFNSPIVIE